MCAWDNVLVLMLKGKVSHQIISALIMVVPKASFLNDFFFLMLLAHQRRCVS